MSLNPILVLASAWVVGVAAAHVVPVPLVDAPSLFAVIGFILMGFFSGWFYFGKLSPVLIALVGVLEGPFVSSFPVAGLLLGVCTIAAGLYGKTLGFLVLEDIYENGQTRLQGYTVAALLNLALILGCGIVVWYLFPILPNMQTLSRWLPFAGLGV